MDLKHAMTLIFHYTNNDVWYKSEPAFFEVLSYTTYINPVGEWTHGRTLHPCVV